MDIIPRHITPLLIKSLKVSPVVFLNGARQTGKSTLARSITREIGRGGNPAVYISFDSPVHMASASSAPEAFLASFDNGLIIDEVQLVPQIFRALKVKVDELRMKEGERANGRYLLTGSANVMALPNLSDSLVGRMSVITLNPFSTAETSGGMGGGLEKMMNLDFSGISDNDVNFVQAIRRGTFPELIGKNFDDYSIWFDGYLATILQRDVRTLAQLEKITVLPNLLRLLAARAGGLINDADIARDAGLNPVTGKFYRNILKMMFLAFDIPPWYRNIGKRMVKSPKGYILDTLMLCHLLDLDLENMRHNRPDMFGRILENYVSIELSKLLGMRTKKAQLFHFRTSDGKEVDFVLERPDGSVFGIEVKNSELIRPGDFKGLKLLAEATGKDFLGGVVLYTGKDALPFGNKLWAVPIHVLWQ